MVSHLTSFGFGFTCLDCGTQWNWSVSESPVCPDCHSRDRCPEALRLAHKDGDSWHELTSWLNSLLPSSHTVQTTEAPDIGPPTVGAGLIDWLTDQGYTHGWTGSDVSVFVADDPSFQTEEIQIWVDESCEYHDNRDTQSAYVVEVDGERLGDWVDPFGCGDEMTNIIGAYGGVIRAVERGSVLRDILSMATSSDGGPELTVRSDVEVVCSQVKGDVGIDEPHLRSLRDEVVDIINRTGASLQLADGSANRAEGLLSR